MKFSLFTLFSPVKNPFGNCIRTAKVVIMMEMDDESSYEAEWFTYSALTLETRVGDVTMTQSEFSTSGLTKGHQYWFRVRAIRANQPGPWSDPVTRVAGL